MSITVPLEPSSGTEEQALAQAAEATLGWTSLAVKQPGAEEKTECLEGDHQKLINQV